MISIRNLPFVLLLAVFFLLVDLSSAVSVKTANGNTKSSLTSPSSDNNNDKQNNDGKEVLPECTVVNPGNNAFYDLSSLSRPAIDKNLAKPAAWAARGFDYNYNFTLGLCASPLNSANIKNNNDIDSSIKNVSLIGGFYTGDDGVKYSIGNYNTTPIFRGKKLLLTYTNGSYCKDSNSVDGYLKDANGKNLRKSTILSFTCDKEIMSRASVSFIGALNDCDYFFEVRTAHACVTPKKADDLAAIWIFLFILFAALSVYFSGGFLYKTFFLRRRGWNQISSNVKSGIKNNSFKRSFVSNYRDGRLLHNDTEARPHGNDKSYSDYDDTDQLLDQLDINLDNVGHEPHQDGERSHYSPDRQNSRNKWNWTE